MLCKSVLWLSNGVESECMNCSSLLSAEKTLKILSMNPASFNKHEELLHVWAYFDSLSSEMKLKCAGNQNSFIQEKQHKLKVLFPQRKNSQGTKILPYVWR